MKIGLFGVAGFNRGDDAIAASILDWVRTRHPHAQITLAVLRHQSAPPLGLVRQVLIDRRSPGGLRRLIASIREQDVILIGGGSLIQDKHGGGRWRGVLGYAWTVTALARLFRKPILAVGLGIDELGSPGGKAAAREVLGRIDWLSVRDRRSADEALALGRGHSDITVGPDPAFAFPHGDLPSGEGDYIVLSPAMEDVGEEHIAALFADIAAAVSSAHPDLRIKIVAMDERAAEDAGKLALIIDRLSPGDASRVDLTVPSDVREAAALLRGAEAIIAMRLHALILGYGFARLYCISRTTKTDALMQEYEIAGGTLGDDPRSLVAGALASLIDDDRFSRQQTLRDDVRSRGEVMRDVLGAAIAELGRPSR